MNSIDIGLLPQLCHENRDFMVAGCLTDEGLKSILAFSVNNAGPSKVTLIITNHDLMEETGISLTSIQSQLKILQCFHVDNCREIDPNIDVILSTGECFKNVAHADININRIVFLSLSDTE